MTEENVKVAVRVRPFNGRERDRQAELIIDMNGPTTIIKNPEDGEEKKFTFDFSYWSFDGSKKLDNGYYAPDTSHPNGRKFCDQKRVFDDLGIGILKNAWEGYNSTLFAYGQTGSGKSWSIVGYDVNKGIVPMFCDQLFKDIEAKSKENPETQYEVIFSMLEIYNEQVRDLLNPKTIKGGLKVRQNPKVGFYAEGLQVVPVRNYQDIENRMEEGTTNRTVASTNMNATSSRAHTIVGITFAQKFKNAAGEDTTKSSVINLVDLAGSERADSTGATGDRLKEGAAINLSLSCLGNVIAALADRSQGKNTRVPYRDSTLTKLLKNALGGNSKTIMIAAVSPADINYEESLSTLRYADRAKQIKTKAMINEDPTEKLIRELQEENEKLKAMLEGKGGMELLDKDEEDELTEEEKEALKKELEDEYRSLLDSNQKEMEEMKKNFEEKLQEAQKLGGGGTDMAQKAEKMKTIPHFSNLNMDPALSGHIIHFVEADSTTIGTGSGDGCITLRGPGIMEKHAVVTKNGNAFTLEPGAPNLRLLRNGKAVTAATELKHNDRVVFGTTQFYVFVNPAERDASKQPFPDVTFDMAQQEIASKGGFDLSTDNKSRDETLLQQDIVDILPAIEEANSISEELDKKKKFDLCIVSPEARGELEGRTEVMVRVSDLETKLIWMWPREFFLNRKFIMLEMYDNFVDGDPWELPQDKDPFYCDPNAESHIGSVKAWLKSLGYLVDFTGSLEITDYKGADAGLLNVEIIPCDKKGKTLAEDTFVDDPKELLGKEVSFLFKLVNARGLPNRYTDVYAKYSVGGKMYKTKPIPNTTNPDWNGKDIITVTVDDEFLKLLTEGAIMVQIWGKQVPAKKKTVNTRNAMLTAAATKGQNHAANKNVKMFDPEKARYMMEVGFLKKRQESMEMRLRYIKKMLDLAEARKKRKVTVVMVKTIYHAPSADVAEKCLQLLEKEGGGSSSSSSDSSDDEGKGGKAKLKPKKHTKSAPQSRSGQAKSSSCVLL